MRILFIGNSHIGCVVRALDAGPRDPGVEVEFLAAPAHRLAGNLRFEGATAVVQPQAVAGPGARMRPSDMDAAGRIDLLRYDRIVLFGLQLLASGAGGERWLEVVRDSAKPYSSALWRAYAVDSVRDTLHWCLASGLGDPAIRARTISLPTPFPNATHPRFKALRVAPNERISAFLEATRAEMEGLGVVYRPLPPELLDDNGHACHARFKHDKEGDHTHLNAAGGRVVLDLILRTARELEPSSRVVRADACVA